MVVICVFFLFKVLLFAADNRPVNNRRGNVTYPAVS